MSTWLPFGVPLGPRGGLDGADVSFLTLSLGALVSCLAFVAVLAVLAVLAALRAASAREPARKPRARIAPVISAATPRTVLFDFDGVLTEQEVRGELSQVGRVRAFGGKERLAILEDCLEELSQYARLGIVSRNYRWVMQQALGQEPDLAQFFDPQLIFGYEDCDDSAAKSSIVERILQESNVDRRQLLFVDDSFLNISDVSQHCNVETLHVRKSGMASWDWEYVLAWAKRAA